MQIARVDIVQFKRGRNVPACTVELEWTGSGEPKPLSHQVKISGAKKPAHFYLRYYPQAVGEFYFYAHMHVHVCMFEFSPHYYSCYQIRLLSSPPVHKVLNVLCTFNCCCVVYTSEVAT